MGRADGDSQAINALTCAAEQFTPSDETEGSVTFLSHSFHIDSVYLGPDLDTAFVIGTLHSETAKSGSSTFQLGLNMLKEQGVWKVCKWYPDQGQGVPTGSRILLLGG